MVLPSSPLQLLKLLILMFFVLPYVSCSAELETAVIVIGDEEVIVELATSEEERATGLMYRKKLDENRGMLFVYEADTKMSFYMKNTTIPLSIAFLTKDGVIREIYDMKPLSLRPINSRYSVRFALEMNQGAFTRLGVGPGDTIVLPADF